MRTPPRILAVDDVPTNLEILQVRLEAQGYEVVTAADGEEALARARELEPDLVLLDIMMPKLDGISVLKQLKQDAAARFVPVILVTAKADTRDVVAGLEAGGDDYLTKPFEQAALVARVRSLLRIKELHDTVQTQAVKLKEQTEQLVELESAARGAGGGAVGGNRAHQPPAAISGAAGGADDRVVRTRRNRCWRAIAARSRSCSAICAASPPSPRRPSPKR